MNIEKLTDLPLFSNIPIPELEKLLELIPHRFARFKKNQYLMFAGDVTTEMGILLEGRLLVLYESEDGFNNIVNNMLPPQIFGEALSATHTEESRFAVYSPEDSLILYMDYQHLLRSTDNVYHQQLIANMFNLMALKVMRMNERMIIASRRRLKEKVMTYLYMQKSVYKSKSFTITLNREQLADYLFVDRSALSYALMQLKKEGQIEYHRNHFTLL